MPDDFYFLHNGHRINVESIAVFALACQFFANDWREKTFACVIAGHLRLNVADCLNKNDGDAQSTPYGLSTIVKFQNLCLFFWEILKINCLLKNSILP